MKERLTLLAAALLTLACGSVCFGQAAVSPAGALNLPYDATTWNGTIGRSPSLNVVRDALSAPIIVRHADGTETRSAADAATDAERGAALVTACAALTAGDHMLLGPFNFTSVSADNPVPSNCTIQGSGMSTFVQLAGGQTGSDVSVFINSNTSVGNSGIRIANLTIDGNNGSNTDTSKKQSAIKLTKCDECVVEGCRLQHFGRSGTDTCVGVLLTGCTDCQVLGNIINDTVDGVTTVASNSLCKRILVANNVIEGTNRDYGLTCHQVEDSVFANNVISECQKNGIQVSYANNNLFIGNRVSACGREANITYPGINVSSVGAPTNNTFVGNQVRDATSGNHQSYAIVLQSSSSYSTLNGNDFANGGTTGIVSNSATGTRQLGNIIADGTYDTPSALTLTNATGLPISTGVSGLGTGIATALGVNTGSAGAPVLFNGAGGTPSSLTLTNATGLPIAGTTGYGTGVAAWLANPLSAQLRTAVSDYTGATGTLVFSGGPTISAPALTGAVTLATGTLTVAGASLTSTATWNDSGGGEVFDWLTANVTDTSSDATSRLLRLRVGGVEKLKVTKAGAMTLASSLTLGTPLTAANGGTGISSLGTSVSLALAQDVNTSFGLVTASGTATLTNKTLTAPAMTGQVTVGTATTASANNDVLIGASSTSKSGLTIQDKASQTAPSLRCVESTDNDANNGVLLYGTGGQVYINSAGVKRYDNAYGSIFPSSGVTKWVNVTNNPFGTADTGFARNAAGVLEINNGTAGTYRDIKARTVISDSTIRLKGYTVATLPAGTTGDLAYVTDATAPTYNGALTGGGAVVVPVFYNGSEWVSH